MKRYIIQNRKGDLALEFVPELGGAITAFRAKSEDGSDVDLMRPAPEGDDFTILDVASFPLTPFSNRIGQGQYVYDGKTYHVGPNFRDEPHPNHGDGWTSPWTLEQIEGGSARRLQFRRQTASRFLSSDK